MRSNFTWRLQRDFTLYLGDWANITGKFSDAEHIELNETFSHLASQMELMLTSCELNPR
ncbi:TPA: type IV toxin-antitoxin system YeeU family antitoxin [Klebsiella quasipneumoniae]|nr:type IV toxin-antitoxin system YeeU family antitoxin [Klebsiella quasipneumoniae]MDX6813521.1 type IV toxin-antitoxin system YeeU family antitoxin [Klebsiella quasipneumoniae]